MKVGRPPRISSMPTSFGHCARSLRSSTRETTWSLRLPVGSSNIITGVRIHLRHPSDADALDMIVRVRPEETSVVTLQSSFQISNSSIDEFARLCDDALRGGIREQKHEKQKDDEQKRLTSRRPVMHCGVTCPDLSLQKQFISIAKLIFASGNGVLHVL